MGRAGRRRWGGRRALLPVQDEVGDGAPPRCECFGRARSCSSRTKVVLPSPPGSSPCAHKRREAGEPRRELGEARTG